MRRLLTISAVLAMILGSFGYAQAHQPTQGCLEDDVRAGLTIVVSAGCRVHGDVWVGKPGRSGFKIFPDSDPETGMVVVCNQNCKVRFPYGGGVTGQLLESLVKDQARDGCGGGCRNGTNVVIWPLTARADS